MKNLLLASTALVAFAGAAAAEVAISGSGRMGIFDNGTDTVFSSRVRVAFALSAESESGLAFGGSIRADNAADGGKGTAGSVFVSGAFGKLSMGDVDGAAKAAVGNLSGVGYTGIGDYNEAAYLTNTMEVPAALYEYSTNGLTVYVSAANPATAAAADEYAIGVKYAFGDYTVAAGYESQDGTTTVTQFTLGVSAAFGPATVKAMYLDSSDLDVTEYGASVDYVVGAATLTAFAMNTDNATEDYTSFGVGAAYDLGGGASVVGGLSDEGKTASKQQFDLGINFSF